VLAKGKQFLLLIIHPVCIVKYGKSLGSDRGKKTSTQKVKDPLSTLYYGYKRTIDVI